MTGARARSHLRRAAAVVTVALSVTACGFDVNLGDVFALTRTGAGGTLTIVVNQSGFISCNGHKQKMISSAMLITARDLQVNLTNDATKNLKIPSTAGTVHYFRVTDQQGTVAFPDRAAATHPTLAQLELFATQVATQVCGLSG